jgi:arginase
VGRPILALSGYAERAEGEIEQIVNILHVKTNLGLRPGGVESLGSTLLELGLGERVGAKVVAPVCAPQFREERDPSFGTRNLYAIARLASEQADRISEILDRHAFPLVLGGDDSVLLGCLLALRRRGSAGLVFIDGHTDYWDLANSLAGEFSESDLWVATGHGPDVVANIEGLRPLVQPRASVIYGHRDRAEQLTQGSEDVYREPVLVRSLSELRSAGIEDAAHHATAFLGAAEVDRVWLHIDADCLDDALMPAVDWRTEGGMTPTELIQLARLILESGLVAGVDVTIYNPSLDGSDLAAGHVLADVIEEILR